MRDIQIRSNPQSAPHNTNPQNSPNRSIEIRTLSEVFQRSLKSAGGEAAPEKTTDSHQEDLTTLEHPGESAATENGLILTKPKHTLVLTTKADMKEEAELLGAGSTSIFPHFNEQIALNIPVQPTLNTGSTHQSEFSSNNASVAMAVSSLLEKMDQLHRILGAKQWQFEWLNGSTVKLSLRISRSGDGEYKASICDCESVLTKDEFISELNRRLEEKQYQVTVKNNHE